MMKSHFNNQRAFGRKEEIMYKFGTSSKGKLSTCSLDLQKVMELAIKRSAIDFGISEGVRSESRQKELYDAGKSQTLNSRHLANEFGKSEACDVIAYINGKVTWDIKYYRKIAQAVFSAAIDLGVQIEWGGHWASFVDGPHYQLAKK